jgi:hypothetical protein
VPANALRHGRQPWLQVAELMHKQAPSTWPIACGDPFSLQHISMETSALSRRFERLAIKVISRSMCRANAPACSENTCANAVTCSTPSAPKPLPLPRFPLPSKPSHHPLPWCSWPRASRGQAHHGVAASHSSPPPHSPPPTLPVRPPPPLPPPQLPPLLPMPPPPRSASSASASASAAESVAASAAKDPTASARCRSERGVSVPIVTHPEPDAHPKPKPASKPKLVAKPLAQQVKEKVRLVKRRR